MHGATDSGAAFRGSVFGRIFAVFGVFLPIAFFASGLVLRGVFVLLGIAFFSGCEVVSGGGAPVPDEIEGVGVGQCGPAVRFKTAEGVEGCCPAVACGAQVGGRLGDAPGVGEEPPSCVRLKEDVELWEAVEWVCRTLADGDNSRQWEWNGSGRWDPGMPGDVADFGEPDNGTPAAGDMACVPAVQLLVVDRDTDRVLRYEGRSGAFFDVVADAGKDAQLYEPSNVALGPQAGVYVTWFGKGHVTQIGSAEFFYHDMTQLEEPVALGAAGPYLYVLGNDTQSVVKLRVDDGTLVSRFGAFQMIWPHDLLVVAGAAGRGDRGTTGYVVGEDPAGMVQRWDLERGKLIERFAPSQGEDELFTGVAIGPDGHLYLADWRNNRVLRYDGRSLERSAVFVPPGRCLDAPDKLGFGPDGHLYVSTRQGILRYNGVTGCFMRVFVACGCGGVESPRGFVFRTLH